MLLYYKHKSRFVVGCVKDANFSSYQLFSRRSFDGRDPRDNWQVCEEHNKVIIVSLRFCSKDILGIRAIV